MIPHRFFYQLVLIALVWVFLMLYGLWPLEPAAVRPPPPTPVTPPRKRSCAPQPLLGPTRKPPGDACEEGVAPRREPSCAPPPLMVSTPGRRRQVDTSPPCCPAADCRDGGWLGLGNIRAQGHPSGGPWRQWHCTGGDGDFLATHGTVFHGQRVSVALSVHVIGCLAAGLGMRGTARVFEVDPHTVWPGLMEAMEQRRAFAQFFRHALHLPQGQLDALYAVLRALKDGTLSEEGALERLSRSPHWVWAALAPESTLRLTIEGGDRTRAMAPRVVHQVAQVLAPGCLPLVLTDGFQEYATALLTP